MMAAHRVGRQLPVVQGSGYALHTPIGGLEMLLKRATALFLVFLFACSGLFSDLAFAAGEDTETIRVGWPIQKGISEIDENGNIPAGTMSLFSWTAILTMFYPKCLRCSKPESLI